MCLHVCERKRQMRGVKRDLIRTSKLPREPWEIFFTEVNSEADKSCRNVQIWMRGIDFFIECTSMGDARITHPSPRRDLFQIRASLDCSFHMGLALGEGSYSTCHIYWPASLQMTYNKHPFKRGVRASDLAAWLSLNLSAYPQSQSQTSQHYTRNRKCKEMNGSGSEANRIPVPLMMEIFGTKIIDHNYCTKIRNTTIITNDFSAIDMRHISVIITSVQNHSLKDIVSQSLPKMLQ